MCDKRQVKYAFFANLRVPMALRRKLRLVLDNNWTKIRRGAGLLRSLRPAGMLTAEVGPPDGGHHAGH